jgi:L-fuconolactonase
MTVDAHVHIWDRATRDHSWLDSQPQLAHRYSIEQYAELAAACGVEQAVLVQVLADVDETREFLAIAAVHDAVAGVVGWVDLEAPDVSEELARLREGPGGDLLVGVRHLVEGESDPAFLERPTVLRGLEAVAGAGLVYDLLVAPHQLPAALAAVRHVESLQAVLDHAAKPIIANGPSEPWMGLVAALAETGRVACKVSGLVTEAGSGWSPEMIQPFVDHLVEAYGPERLLFGSDWPVCNAVAALDEVVALVNALIEGLAPEERLAVLSGNARRVYGLRPRSNTAPQGPGPDSGSESAP